MDNVYLLQLTALDEDSGKAISRSYFLESEEYDRMMIDLPSPFTTHEVSIDALIVMGQEHQGEFRLVEKS